MEPSTPPRSRVLTLGAETFQADWLGERHLFAASALLRRVSAAAAHAGVIAAATQTEAAEIFAAELAAEYPRAAGWAQVGIRIRQLTSEVA